MKTMKPLLALLAFLPAFATSPLPAADQEMECKMCKECAMCKERMEKRKGLPEMKPMPQLERMPQMERMRQMQQKMQRMEPMQRMEHMERMQRERMGPHMPPPSGEPPDVKSRLAEADLAAILQQYQKVRHMAEETRTELKLLWEDGAEEKKKQLSDRLERLEQLAAELREKAQGCCAAGGPDQAPEKKGHGEGHQHPEKKEPSEPAKAEPDQPDAEPHH